MRARRTIAAVALTAACTLIAVRSGEACSCLPDERPPDAARRDYAAVFTGTVASVEPIRRDRGPGGGVAPEQLHVTLRVDRSWQGVAGDEAVVTTSSSGALCGYRFEVGKRYLVWARRTEAGKLTVSLCSRTRALDAADEEIRLLGKPERVVVAP